MPETNMTEQLLELNKASKRSVALFHRFATAIGISDSALGVLYALMEAETACSQYDLCHDWAIPKQTINSAVAALQKRGYVSLVHVAGARNKKGIVLTDAGRAFAEETVGKLRRAELRAFAALSPEERALYVRLNSQYNACLHAQLDAGAEE